MNSKKVFMNLFSFFLFILLIGIVNAQEDFKASTKGSVELCPCSNQAYTITVQNTGTTASSYTILASGNAAGWITFNPDKFILQAGQKGSFFVFVNSECNIEGDYDLEVFITTKNGLTKVVKQVLKFFKCYDYSLEQGEVIDAVEEKSARFLQHDGSYILCKDEQKLMPILITNNENFENRYKILFDAPEWAELNLNNVRLGAKKTGILLINYDTTDVAGNFNFKLDAISELGRVQRKKNIEVSVKDCYALELELEKDEDTICSGEEQNYNIAVKNPVTFEKSVKLEVDGPEWASLGNASFDLKYKEGRAATLSANPEDDVSGNFLVTIFSIVENKSKASDGIKIDVIPKSECYKAEIDAKTSVTNFYNQDFFFAKVKNDGIKKADYKVSLDGVSWVSVSPETLELNPGQSGNLNLNVNPGIDIEPGTYGIKINLESNDKIYSKNVDIVLKKESEFSKKAKAIINAYRYYIYLLVLIIVLLMVFRKQMNRIAKKLKKDHEKYKIRQERLKALRLARKEKEEEEKKKDKERLEEKIKEKPRKKGLEKREKKIKKFKIPIKKVWIYILILIAAFIFVGHQNRWFNAKYLHLYIRNLFVGYLYYILIGIGVVVVLFLLLLFYNFVSKEGKKKKKVKKEITMEVKKAEKRVKRKKKYSVPYFKILTLIILGLLIYAAVYFDLVEDITNFIILYQYYFISGIIILTLIILLIRFYKPLFKFLKE